MSKKSWQVMYKFFKHINFIFVFALVSYYFYLSWPFIKLATVDFLSQLTPGPVVFNFFMNIVPPYRLQVLHYAVKQSNFSFNTVSESTKVFKKYPTYLEIPSASIKGPIVEGNDEKAMDKGFWHYPGTGDIKNGGNIVIIGHRYLKLPPAKDTFFNLDKVSVGDKVFLKNKLGTWTFIVIKKKIVEVGAVDILQNNQDKLTLITCHPVWTSKERLVVIAKPVKKSSENIF